MTWTKRIVAVLFVLAVAGIVALSLRPKKEKPVSVQTTVAKRASITRRVTAAGKLQPATQVKVSSNLSGDLLELPVKEGEHVVKGKLLARIDSRRYAAQVRQQEALKASAAAELSVAGVDLERLRAERDRVKRLVDAASASRAEFERAESEVAAQQARVQSVKERIAQATAALAESSHLLSLTTLYAPIDGVITSVLKQVGERVRGSDFAEDVILVVSTLNSMEVKVEVGEHEVVYLREGDKSDVEVDAIPDKKWPATVVEIAKNANIKNLGTEAEVTTFPVRLAMDAPAPGGLPGMSAEVTISTETHDNAVVLPIQAVTARTERELSPDGGAAPVVESQVVVVGAPKKTKRDPTQKVVFVVKDGVAHVRRVETGLASEIEIEIVTGLEEGEVVVEGPYRVLSRELKEGNPVESEAAGAAGKKEEENRT